MMRLFINFAVKPRAFWLLSEVEARPRILRDGDTTAYQYFGFAQ